MSESDWYYLGVKLNGSEKSYFFSTVYGDFAVGDFVVVETISGLELGTVSVAPKPLSEYNGDLALKTIVRKPTINDLNDYRTNIEDAKEAMDIAQAESQNLGLGMNIVDAFYTLDATKVTITYTAEGRVDFRELLKILAARLHCRIELRQIAPREKAKMIGGIGVCGLPLCCSTFLHEFEGISLSRAKNQMLTLNIPKLSGACGKLICCLMYEDEVYTEAKKEFPSFGQIIHLDEGDYTVDSFNIISKNVRLVNASRDDFKSFSLEDIKAIQNGTYKKPSLDEPAPLPDVEVGTGKENSYQGQRDNRQGGGNNNHNRHNHHHGHHHGDKNGKPSKQGK